MRKSILQQPGKILLLIFLTACVFCLLKPASEYVPLPATTDQIAYGKAKAAYEKNSRPDDCQTAKDIEIGGTWMRIEGCSALYMENGEAYGTFPGKNFAGKTKFKNVAYFSWGGIGFKNAKKDSYQIQSEDRKKEISQWERTAKTEMLPSDIKRMWKRNGQFYILPLTDARGDQILLNCEGDLDNLWSLDSCQTTYYYYKNLVVSYHFGRLRVPEDAYIAKVQEYNATISKHMITKERHGK